MRVAILCAIVLALTPSLALSQSTSRSAQADDSIGRLLVGETADIDQVPQAVVPCDEPCGPDVPCPGSYQPGYGGQHFGPGPFIDNPWPQPCGCGPGGHHPPCRLALPACEIRGSWWEAMPGGVVRQIELHPSGKYNEVIFNRSGQRLEVVIGSYLISGGELTLLVEGLPQRETRTVTITKGGQQFEISYTVGSSGPYVISCNQATGQIVLTDASGASRVWMRHPPPRFGLPVTGPHHGPGYHQAFPWLPNGGIDSATPTAAAVAPTAALQPASSGDGVESAGFAAPGTRLADSAPPHGAQYQANGYDDHQSSGSYGPPAGSPYHHNQPAACDCKECQGSGYGPHSYGQDPYGSDSYGSGSYGGSGATGYDQQYGPSAYQHGPPVGPYGSDMCGCGQPDCRMNCSPMDGEPFCECSDGQQGDGMNSWIRADYLYWWTSGMRLPPLVTTSPSGTPQTQAGVLGQPGTQTLFGGGEILEDNFKGGRIRGGHWFKRHPNWGVGAEYLQLARESQSFSATSDGNPILARPFFNTQTDTEDAQLVAYPGVISGTVASVVDSELLGAGAHLRHLRCLNDDGNLSTRGEALYGYRYLQLDESVQVTENLATSTATPDTFDILDRFETLNTFNGFDVGWLYSRTKGLLTCECLLRMAVGNNRQTVRINGQTTIAQTAVTPVTFPGGLLTQSSNIGTYNRNQFSVVPEFNATVACQLTGHCRATLGYSFLYWSNVVRPGDQIDREVNPNLIPPPVSVTGALRPAFAFVTTDYWAQGLNFGLECEW